MEIKKHFGVYGVCYKYGYLLCIQKTAGPYKNRIDLPGGSQQLGEGLTETLIREVLEETGFTVRSYSNPRIYDVFVGEELTNTEANCLEGTKEHFDENHPLFGYRGTRRLLACPDEFQAEAHVVTEVYQTNPNLSVIFPFINDAEQLKQAITALRHHGFTGKVGTMIELPSAYFDLDRILETGISKIIVGMNDLTSFVFATVRNSQWHDMESPIMLDMLRDMQDKARIKKIDFAVAGYLNTSFIQKMNQMGIKCIIHYSSIPEIFNLEIDHPDHLKRIKEVSKKLQRSNP